MLRKGLGRLLSTMKARGDSGREEHGAHTYDSYTDMAREPQYRAMLDLTPPLSEAEWQTLVQNDFLTAVLWQTRCPGFVKHFGPESEPLGEQALAALQRRDKELVELAMGRSERFGARTLRAIMESDILLLAAVEHGGFAFFEALGTYYSMPASVAKLLLTRGWQAFREYLGGAPATHDTVTFADLMRERLEVHAENHKVLAAIINDFNVSKQAYFTVGCGDGLPLVSGVRLGFPVVHGCEWTKACFKAASDLTPLAATRDGLDVQYFQGEFAALPLSTDHYSLITMRSVLERVADLEGTIAKLAEVIAPDGVCHIVQENGWSPLMAQDDPRYGLPLLPLLPSDLAARILVRLEHIRNEEDYPVTQWPRYETLQRLFTQNGLEATFHGGDLGHPKGLESLAPKDTASLAEEIDAHAEATLYPVLEASERKQVKDLLAAYLAELKEATTRKTPDDEAAFFTPVWRITLRRGG